MRETFIIRTEWASAIMELEPLDQATIFQNLFHYHSGNENLINLKNLTVKLVWRLIEPNLHRNIESYDKRRDTSSENGKLGGRPRKTVDNNLNNLNKPSTKPNENEKPNESLSVSVSVCDIKEEKKENGVEKNVQATVLLDDATGKPVTVNSARPSYAPTWDETVYYFNHIGKRKLAVEFFNHHESNNWQNKKGQPIGFWQGLANGWASRSSEKQPVGDDDGYGNRINRKDHPDWPPGYPYTKSNIIRFNNKMSLETWEQTQAR